MASNKKKAVKKPASSAPQARAAGPEGSRTVPERAPAPGRGEPAKKNGKARARNSRPARPTPKPSASEGEPPVQQRGRSRSGAKPAVGAEPRPAAGERGRAARARSTAAAVEPVTMRDEGGPSAVPGLSDEDQIRAAKYLPRELPRRLFEEERYLFPETYGVNRIRLLVRDPEWIFAYWDVSPEGMKELGRTLGERALALSRLTLRVLDPVSGASSDILLPPGARWWYVRTDMARRTYRAELGVTLPSGEFRRIAESNTVVTPRVGPSAERARRKMSYAQARDLPLSAAEAASAAEKRTGVAEEPWRSGAVDGAPEPDETKASDKGGASDAFRPGASDAFRG